MDGVKIVSTARKAGECTIAVRPEDIFISKNQIVSSARNRYKGVIVDIIDKGMIRKIVVDIHIPFTVIVTKRSFDDMALSIGMCIHHLQGGRCAFWAISIGIHGIRF